MTNRRRWTLLVLAVLAAGVLSACGSDPVFPPDFDDSLSIDLSAMTKTSSGLYYLDMAVGSGATAVTGKKVTVTYSGWLANGQLFESGLLPPFTLGAGQVIAGFDEGVTGMKVGGKRRLVIPPKLGYGNQGIGAIPPNSTLIFEVELTAVQ